jgi:hypothetical protein
MRRANQRVTSCWGPYLVRQGTPLRRDNPSVSGVHGFGYGLIGLFIWSFWSPLIWSCWSPSVASGPHWKGR